MREAHTERTAEPRKAGKRTQAASMRNKKNLLVKKENAEYTEYSAYMADGKLVYVERSLKNGTDELTEYIWAGSTLWAEKRTAGTESTVYYHHTDYHGSTEAITDEAGVVVWKAGYDAYGNMLQATGVMEFEASFTGKMFDKDSGLYYFNARWYDSELGRFTTPDPARDGTNWLVFCAANPVGRWDPSGLTTLDDYAYQQRTNSQPGSEEYENSFKTEEEAARRNQGVSTGVATPQSRWLDTIKPAINLDFGKDYAIATDQAWKNREYLDAVLFELTGTCEMAYDSFLTVVAAYSGAKALGAIVKAGVMLKTTLSALSPSSTVVLGRYDEGSCGGYTKMADVIGASYFQLPDRIYKILEKIKVGETNLGKIVNEKWLDGVINSGARILMNFDPSIAPEGSSYAMELEKLKNYYSLIKTTVNGIECWEAVK